MTEIIVETTYGKVKGITEESVYSFKGIPYGAPTGESNRFMSPVKPDRNGMDPRLRILSRIRRSFTIFRWR